MIINIKSNKNKIVKYAKSLHMKKYRDAEGKFLIEGIKLIREALDYNISLCSILYHDKCSHNPYIKDIINKCIDRKIKVYELDEKPYMDISETKSSQGIIAIGKKKNYNIDTIIKKDKFNIVLLEKIQDPGNVGTIIRAADAFGFDMVILSKGCADVYSSKAIRSTMGSLFHIPVVCDVEIKDVLNNLEQVGVYTLAATPHGGLSCFDVDFKCKNAIIIGNESNGLSEEIMDMAEAKVNIPMVGKAESLNAGISASIIMYEIMRYKMLNSQ